MTDCDAVSTMHDVQKYAKLPEDAVADALKAGTSQDCLYQFELLSSRLIKLTSQLGSFTPREM